MSGRYDIGVCSLRLLLFTALISKLASFSLFCPFFVMMFIPFSLIEIFFLLGVLLQAVEVNAIAVPSSSCYAFDNSSHIVDFVSYIVWYILQLTRT